MTPRIARLSQGSHDQFGAPAVSNGSVNAVSTLAAISWLVDSTVGERFFGVRYLLM